MITYILANNGAVIPNGVAVFLCAKGGAICLRVVIDVGASTTSMPYVIKAGYLRRKAQRQASLGMNTSGKGKENK